MLTKMPAVGPRPSSSADPTTGPNRMPRLRKVAFRRTALGRSAVPTKSCSISCSPGVHSEPAMPCSTSSTQASQTCSEPVRNRTPQVADTSHEQHLRGLDDPAAVVAVGQRAEVDREQQERHPVADHLEPGQRRGVELLPQHPVGDDVLDVVGHHRQRRAEQVRPAVTVAQRGELARRSGERGGDRRSTTATASGSGMWVAMPQAAHMSADLLLERCTDGRGPGQARRRLPYIAVPRADVRTRHGVTNQRAVNAPACRTRRTAAPMSSAPPSGQGRYRERQDFRNASRSALNWSLCVLVSPCGAPG